MTTIGIDLGTTNSVAAFHNRETKQTKVLPNRLNEDLTPSVVSINRRGELLIGRPAWNNALIAPQDTIFSVKRLMGRLIDDQVIDHVRNLYPFTVVAADDPNKPDDRGVRVLISKRKYTPVDISAEILRQIKNDASQRLPEEVTHAIITVPAYFTEPQRHATREAGKQAGLVVQKIIDEPTAAAVAFGMDRTDEQLSLLVFDLGGGTFDISLLQAYKGDFAVIAFDGNRWLGGDDFDMVIVDMMSQWVQATYQINPQNDKRFLMEARRKAEETKRFLSMQEEVDVIIPSIPLASGDVIGIDMVVTRQQFEQGISDLVERCLRLVKQVMSSQGLEAEDISNVLLVGGSTAVPLIQQRIAAIFGKDKVIYGANSMYAVAQGAAILAAGMDGVLCPQCNHVNGYQAQVCVNCETSLAAARSANRSDAPDLDEVTGRNLGIGVVTEDGQPDVFSPIITAGTSYPMPREQTIWRPYTAHSRTVRIPVYEGNKEVASNNEYLGLVEYELPDDAAVPASLQVGFNYDRDRTVTVRIKVEGFVGPDFETALVRDMAYMPTQEHKDDDWRQQLQSAIGVGERMLEEYGEFMNIAERTKLEEALRLSRPVLLNEKDPILGRNAINALLSAINSLGTANFLYLADHLRNQVEPDEAAKLVQASQSLREAFKENNIARINQIQVALDASFKILSRRLAQGVGEVDEGLNKWIWERSA